MDPQKFTEQLSAQGFDEIFTTTLPANKQLAAHSHAYAVKALVTDGHVTLGVDGRLTTYRTGEVFTMAPGCEHTELYGETGVSYVVGRKHP